MKNVTEQIKEILLEELVMEKDELENNLNSKISDHIDSLEKIETAMELEKQLNIPIPDSTIEKWNVIQDIIDTTTEIYNYYHNSKN